MPTTFEFHGLNFEVAYFGYKATKIKLFWNFGSHYPRLRLMQPNAETHSLGRRTWALLPTDAARTCFTAKPCSTQTPRCVPQPSLLPLTMQKLQFQNFNLAFVPWVVYILFLFGTLTLIDITRCLYDKSRSMTSGLAITPSLHHSTVR